MKENINDEMYQLKHNKLVLKMFNKSDDELFQIALKIRIEVFVIEQQFKLENEMDYIDDCATHYILFLNSEEYHDDIINEKSELNSEKQIKYIPVGTARSYNNKILNEIDNNGDDYIYIGRVALLKQYRKFGFGKELMNLVIKSIKENNINKIKVLKISSQDQAVDFYKKIGFKIVGEGYYDEHVLHYDMIMELF